MMLEEIRVLIGNFLNIIIIDNPYIFVNLWSFIHLMMGAGIMYLFLKYKISTPFLFLFGILFTYEIVEYVLYTYLLTNIFIPETLIDVTWDMIIGMLSGTTVYFYKNQN